MTRYATRGVSATTIEGSLRQHWKRPLLIGGLVLLQLLVILPATASNWAGSTGQSGCGKFNMQDNSTMTYYRKDLTTEMYNAVGHALNNAVLPTDVWLSAEAGSENSTLDVVYEDGNYTGTFCGLTWHSAGNLLGYTRCDSLAGSDCEHFHIYSDTGYWLSKTTAQRRTHACHELGHSLGLKHPSSTGGCVQSGSTSTTYSSHDEGHINANY